MVTEIKFHAKCGDGKVRYLSPSDPSFYTAEQLKEITTSLFRLEQLLSVTEGACCFIENDENLFK
jgi:hypothetical protein